MMDLCLFLKDNVIVVIRGETEGRVGGEGGRGLFWKIKILNN